MLCNKTKCCYSVLLVDCINYNWSVMSQSMQMISSTDYNVWKQGTVTVKFPLIHTSKSESGKCCQGLCGKKEKDTAKLCGSRKSPRKLIQTFPARSLPPFTEAICFDPLHFEWPYWNSTYGEDPLLALCTEIFRRSRKKNQWSSSWCLFKTL